MFRFLTYVVLFVALATSAVDGDSAYASTSGSAEIEALLSSSRAYDIRGGISVLDWFAGLISNAEQDARTHPEREPKDRIMIGDAYHWIGHIYEDRGEFKLAMDGYQKSYENYLRTPIRHSIFISNLLTREHAKFHINEMATKLGVALPFDMRHFAEENVDTGLTTEECLRFYRSNIGEMRDRHRARSPGTCYEAFAN